MVTTLKLIQNEKVGGILENSGYLLQSGRIFKIEEVMTEKKRPKVGNPPLKKIESTAHNVHFFDALLPIHDLYWALNLLHVLLEG